MLDAQRRVLGVDDSGTLMTWHKFATLLWERGQLEAAEAEFRALLDARRRALGQEHVDTLATKYNLATVQQKRRGN